MLRPRRARTRAARPARAGSNRRGVRENELGDLDRVQRRALAQVVADEEEREPVLDGRIAADPADEHVVSSGGLLRRRERRSSAQRPARRAARPRPPPATARSSVSTQTASAWPTITGTRTQVALTGRSGSSRIFRVSSRSFASSSNSSPSKSQSMRRSCSSGVSARSRSIDCAPAPETDWYVATRTRVRPAASWSGFRAQVSGIVQQFGLATMPSCSARALAVHLGHDERHAVCEPVGRRTCRPRSRRPRRRGGRARALAEVPTEKRQRSSSPRRQRLGRRLLDEQPVELACRPSGRTRRRARCRSRAREQRERDRADRAGRADDADPSLCARSAFARARTPRAGPARRGRRPSRRDVAGDLDRRRASRSAARCPRRRASRTSSRRRRGGSSSRRRPGSPSEVVARAPRGAELVEHAASPSCAVLDRRREDDLARPVCRIVSTLTRASASAAKSRRAPRRRPRGRRSPRAGARRPEISAFSSIRSSSSRIQVPSLVARTSSGRAGARRGCARPRRSAVASTLRARRRHLEHLLVARPHASLRAPGTRRGSAVKTPSTSV